MMSASENKSALPGMANGSATSAYHGPAAPHNQQTHPPAPLHAPSAQSTWSGGTRTAPSGGTLNEKEQLALSDLLTNSFTASFWNFRTRFERYMLFFAFILCSVLLVCVVLMIFLIVNTSLLKGIAALLQAFRFFAKWMTHLGLLRGQTASSELNEHTEHYILLTGPWTM